MATILGGLRTKNKNKKKRKTATPRRTTRSAPYIRNPGNNPRNMPFTSRTAPLEELQSSENASGTRSTFHPKREHEDCRSKKKPSGAWSFRNAKLNSRICTPELRSVTNSSFDPVSNFRQSTVGSARFPDQHCKEGKLHFSKETLLECASSTFSSAYRPFKQTSIAYFSCVDEKSQNRNL